MSSRVSPFLQGAFTPLYTERTAHRLPVKGRIPPELDGLFTQIGGNPVAPPRRRGAEDYSWFSQDGMVCGIRLRDGRAEWFRNRWIRSRRVCRSLGESRPPGPRRFFTDVVNTNVVCHGGLLLALVETGCLPVRLSETLDTVEYSDLGGGLPIGITAHPKTDPVSGELFALAYSPLHTSADYLVITAEGTIRKTERIPLGGRPMMHDIALTEKHVVLFDLPVRFHLGQAARGRFPFRWDGRHQARIGLLPREGGAGSLRWFSIAPCFVFHAVNATEENGVVRIYALRYPKMFDGTSQDPFAYGACMLWEWTIDPATGKVTERQLDDHQQELPRIDPRRIGRPFRHCYGISAREQGLSTYEPEVLLKHDFARERTEERAFPRGSVPTEPVFVPRAGNGAAEDDGWILHFRIDALHHESDLVVLDARDFTGPPVATVRLPVRVPFGFHSNWIPDAELDAVGAGLGPPR
ncbi:carotenoid oxygenase family protein [Streptomyces sp. NPDC057271]|uniref:carotenoid oxygenase family protein n=2 Tax=Streptomyces TaxID=1883 RepID=UPI00362FFF83